MNSTQIGTAHDLLLALRAKRLRDGLSPERLAAQLGISGQTIRNLEAGSLPSPSVAQRVAAYMEEDPLEIWPALLGAEGANH